MNYWKLENRGVKLQYAFLDTPKHLADQEFIKNRIRVTFFREWESPDKKYRVVFVTLWKRDNDKFLASMNGLYKKMLIMGHTDYPDACANLQHLFQSAAK